MALPCPPSDVSDSLEDVCNFSPDADARVGLLLASLLTLPIASEMAVSNYNALLLDIEGTTTSISFVKDTLFPFVRQEVGRYLSNNWDTREVRDVVNSLLEQNDQDIRDGLTDQKMLRDDAATVVANVLWQMDNDRKAGALKRLQGLIFREAYSQGHLHGHVYDDVPAAFDVWTKSGKKIFIYSSGSVEAQKLLFGHSTHGNLCRFLSGYFDTTVGHKVVSSSYTKISDEIKLPPQEILFLTDIAKEAHAAREAGLQVRLCVRPGNGDLTADDVSTFGTVNSFDELLTKD